MSSSKRILFINDHLRHGGVGTATRLLAQQMAAMGHDVTIATLFYPAEVEGVKMLHLNVGRLQRWLVVPMVFKLIRLLRQQRPDFIISAKDFINIWVVCAYRLAGLQGSKLLVNAHNNQQYILKNGAWAINRWSIWLSRYLYRLADHVANVSAEASQASARFLGLKRVETLYNPILHPEDLTRTYSQPPHRFFDGANKVVIACGRLEKQKNHHFMLQAFANAHQTCPDLRLIILGDGSLRPQLEVLRHQLGLDEVVDMPGFVDNPRDYMAHGCAVWLTSLYEGFGIVLIEAMATGTQVVSIDCEYGPAEILDHGRLGTLVQGYDADIHAQKLLEAIEKPVCTASQLKQQASRFDVQACTQAYLDVLSA